MWRVWLALAGSIAGLALALFGVFERTTLSENAWRVLSSSRSYPVSWIVLAALAAGFATSAGFILLLRISDGRRLREARRKLAERAGQAAGLTEDRNQALARLREKARDYENLESLFRDRERLRMLDAITGIPNYQAWEDDLRKWASRGRTEKEFSLILIDLDNLKWLNDRSRDCADEILRFFARRTYDSMRRDEQLYKAPERGPLPVAPAAPAPEMYRHYQGGDEFFFIIGGDVYGAVGFVNRLADRINGYKAVVDEEILARYLTGPDRALFRFSFSGVIAPIHPGAEPSTALPNAYSVLGRAKASPRSRLLVVFEESYDDPAHHRAELERRMARIRTRLASGEAVAQGERTDLEERERALSVDIAVLKKAEQLFQPAPSRPRPAA